MSTPATVLGADFDYPREKPGFPTGCHPPARERVSIENPGKSLG
jgi:hypothetical protein